MITIITGPMFSGKSREVFNILDRCYYKKKTFVVFKPKLDTRLDNVIFTRNGKTINAINISNSEEILNYLEGIDLVVIDEVQFLDLGIVEIVRKLVFMGKEVLLAGLDKDINGKPFGCIGDLLALADNVIKLKSVCHNCGKDATFSIRLTSEGKIDSSTEIKIDVAGEKNFKYEARCYDCFNSNL